MKITRPLSLIVILLVTFMLFGCDGKNSPSKTQITSPQVSSNIPNNEIAKKTDEIINKANKMNNLYEKVNFVLDTISKSGKEIQTEKFFQFALNNLKNFLETEQSYKLTETEYKSLSENIKVFKLGEKRIITYEADNSIYGESGAPIFTFLQYRTDGKINVIELYANNTRRILSVFQPQNDDKLIILSGIEKESRPWKAFIDSFIVDGSVAKKVEVLGDYKDNYWEIDSTNGLIYRIDKPLIETFINKGLGDSVEVNSSDNKAVNLKFDYELQKYVIAKESESIQR